MCIYLVIIIVWRSRPDCAHLRVWHTTEIDLVDRSICVPDNGNRSGGQIYLCARPMGLAHNGNRSGGQHSAVSFIIINRLMLQYVAVCCSVLQHTDLPPEYLCRCVAVRCSMWQYVAVCCSV